MVLHERSALNGFRLGARRTGLKRVPFFFLLNLFPCFTLVTPSSLLLRRNPPQQEPSSVRFFFLCVCRAFSMTTPSLSLNTSGAEVIDTTTPSDNLGIVNGFALLQILSLTPKEAGGGRTFLATSVAAGTYHTVRVIPLKALRDNPRLRLQIEREATIQRALSHPHVQRLTTSFFSRFHLFLVFDFCEGGELFDAVETHSGAGKNVADRSSGEKRVQETPGMPRSIVKRIFKELLDAVSYIHAEGVCHRDIKLETVHLDADNHVVLTSFGMATAFRSTPSSASSKSHVERLTVSCGSKHYACPEIVKAEPYDGRAADLWSCAVVLFALATGSLPFEDSPDGGPDVFEKITCADIFLAAHPALQNLHPQDPLVSLLRGMLEPLPHRRMSPEAVRSHEFWTWVAPPVPLAATANTARNVVGHDARSESKRSPVPQRPAAVSTLPKRH